MSIYILLYRGNQKIGQFLVEDEKVVTIGKVDCDLALPSNEQSLSRHHATISVRSDGVFYTDKSTNGSFLNAAYPNGKKLAKGVDEKINPGDQIYLSDTQLRIIAHTAPEIGATTDITTGNLIPSASTGGTLDIQLNPSVPPKATPPPLEKTTEDPPPAHQRKKLTLGGARPPQTSSAVGVPTTADPGPARNLIIPPPPQGNERRKITIGGIAEPSLNPVPGVNTESYSFAELLNRKGRVTIGRDPQNDIVLNSLQVSRKHAMIEKAQGGAIIHDYSQNGVFVDGVRVDKSRFVTEKNRISIVNFTISIQGEVADANDTGTIPAIFVENVIKEYSGKNGTTIGLQELSLSIKPKEFVALMGPSGCGKSTFLKCLNGDNPASKGKVTIQGIELNSENFNLIKRNIGYVPQDNIIHSDLTVNQTMYYAAKLRMPEDISQDEIDRRIDKVLSDLNINSEEIRNNKVAKLSGGQRKRVSIAVELLPEPSILFLDEPTSPLDPETIEDFLGCLRKLVDAGTTIIMVTHKPDDLKFADKVLFLARKGYAQYFGSVEDAYAMFNVGKDDIIKIYASLTFRDQGKVPDSEKPVELAKENKIKERYGKFKQVHQVSNNQNRNQNEIKKPEAESSALQLYWLFSRYLKIKLNNSVNITILLAQPFIIGGLTRLIYPKFQLGVMFLMAISAVWFGVSNAAREIVDEQSIYKRERMYNVKILPYIFSKILVLALIAAVQTIIFVSIIKFAYPEDVGVMFRPYAEAMGFVFYLAVSATIMGLVISASPWSDNAETVMTIVPIALIPQIMLAGVISRIDNKFIEGLSYATFSRWGTEGLSRLQDEATLDAEAYVIRAPDIPGASPDTLLKSVHIRDPRSTFEEVIYDRSGALKLLFFYPPPEKKDSSDHQNNNQNKQPAPSNPDEEEGEEGESDDVELMGTFNSFMLNLAAITGLNAILLIFLYIFLRKKDTI